MPAASDAFVPLRLALDRAAIRYAVGGSWASTAFGEPRLTNDVDILADFTPDNLPRFLDFLPPDFYFDREHAGQSLRLGRPFNVIYMPLAVKFDFFPAAAFPLGARELERSVLLPVAGLSEIPTPFVTPEDILLAKLHWFRAGGEVSEVQWRDVEGIVRSRRDKLDRSYLEQSASMLGLTQLLAKALNITERPSVPKRPPR